MRSNTPIATRARAFRKSMSPPEVLLWTRLRGRSPDKPTFRRQHSIGSIIVDFYCPSAKLAQHLLPEISVNFSSHHVAGEMKNIYGTPKDVYVNRRPALHAGG